MLIAKHCISRPQGDVPAGTVFESQDAAEIERLLDIGAIFDDAETEPEPELDPLKVAPADVVFKDMAPTADEAGKPKAKKASKRV